MTLICMYSTGLKISFTKQVDLTKKILNFSFTLHKSPLAPFSRWISGSLAQMHSSPKFSLQFTHFVVKTVLHGLMILSDGNCGPGAVTAVFFFVVHSPGRVPVVQHYSLS